MKNLVFLCMLIFFTSFMTGCAPKQPHVTPDIQEKTDIAKLTQTLTSMSSNVSPAEAKEAARESIMYSKELAYRYGIVTAPWFHNFLVNIGVKKRGLCYQWAMDMKIHLESLHLKTLTILWAVANDGEYFEHNTIVLGAKNVPFEKSIVIDPWRHYDPPYWGRVEDDKYSWVLDKRFSK